MEVNSKELVERDVWGLTKEGMYGQRRDVWGLMKVGCCSWVK